MNRIVKSAVFSSVATLALSAGPFASAAVLQKSVTIDGTTITYKVVTPNGFDPAKTYPAILAFPPGEQNMAMVDTTLEDNYRPEAEKRGYLVFEPAAPGPGLYYFTDSASLIPGLMKKITTDYKILGNKFHIAGNSNGGLSAFTVAVQNPKSVWSITGFPGYLQDEFMYDVNPLQPICMHMFAGELDAGWPEEEQTQSSKWRRVGFHVTFSLEKGEPHVIRGLTGKGAARLFDQFDAARQGKCE